MNNKEVAQKVVDRIVEMIDEGKPLPWVKPWNREPNTVTVVDGVKTVTLRPTAWNRKGVAYKGSNAWLPVGEYITFKQVKAEGGTVNKGARSFPVVYWNFIEKEEKNPDTGEVEKKTVPLLKYYNVFRIEDTSLKQKHNPQPKVIEIPITHTVIVDSEHETNETAEVVIADYVERAGTLRIDREGISEEAYYRPSTDYVKVPSIEQYTNVSEFYSTLFHELGHSTGHKDRLNRFTGKAASAGFGSQEYSKEELVAETTAAGILNALGMEDGNSFRNSAAYIKSWASHIKNEPMMFVTAAQRAQDAIELILGVKE